MKGRLWSVEGGTPTGVRRHTTISFVNVLTLLPKEQLHH